MFASKETSIFLVLLQILQSNTKLKFKIVILHTFFMKAQRFVFLKIFSFEWIINKNLALGFSIYIEKS